MAVGGGEKPEGGGEGDATALGCKKRSCGVAPSAVAGEKGVWGLSISAASEKVDDGVLSLVAKEPLGVVLDVQRLELGAEAGGAGHGLALEKGRRPGRL
eukprot:CAMPEP_0117081006 /NCGR_PEP_ID=MMETSP0472-20121206/57127_1 /TAXON_ID=693140 ORGANISM="Tiarina fusus, Strain LIS" /NCGR_SAMPLE_ID=MMETSP0472 /ASSEMBLY_ACC=CAM_ASM_000603 /LENGTH=98 /DNA_ID=CAMNT_0004808825 /DNA_START=104 /DNA_END=396 /DNA_ORIENTATION=-